MHANKSHGKYSYIHNISIKIFIHIKHIYQNIYTYKIYLSNILYMQTSLMESECAHISACAVASATLPQLLRALGLVRIPKSQHYPHFA